MAQHKNKHHLIMTRAAAAASLCAALLLMPVYSAQAAGEADHGHAE